MAEYDGDIKLGVTLEPKEVKKSANQLAQSVGNVFKGTASKKMNSQMKSLQSTMSSVISKMSQVHDKMTALEEARVVPDSVKKAYNDLVDVLVDNVVKLDDINEQLKQAGEEIASNPELQAAVKRFIELGQQMEELEQQISLGEASEEAVASLEKIRSEYDELQTYINENSTVLKLQADATEIEQKIAEINEQLESMRVSGTETEEYQRLKLQLADYNNQLRVLKSRYDESTESVKKNKKETSGLLTTFRKIGTLGSAALEKLKKSLKGTAREANNVNKALSFKKLFLFIVGVASLKQAFNKLKNAIKEGLTNMANWNGGMNSANNSISQLMSSLNYLKNAWGAAFAPILAYVAPVLSRLIDMLATAANYIGAFFAALTGKGTFVKAKKVMTNYAKSVGGAAQAAKDQKKAEDDLEDTLKEKLGSYDKLEVIQDDSSKAAKDAADALNDAGGGVEDPFAGMFEEVKVDESLPEKILDWIQRIKDAWSKGEWENVGRIIAEGLNAGMQIVDDWIMNKFVPLGTKWAEIFARILNGLVDGLDLELLGKTVSDGIWGVFKILNTFLEMFDFKALSAGIGRALKEAFGNEQMWTEIGSFFANKWNALIRFIEGLVSTENLGSNLGKGLAIWVNNAFTKIDLTSAGRSLGLTMKQALEGALSFLQNLDAAGIAQNISTGIRTALQSLTKAAKEFDWTEFGHAIAEKLGEFFANIEWSGIIGDLSEFAGALLGGILAALVAIGEDIWEGIKGLFDDIKKTYFEPYMDEYGQMTIEGFFNGLLDAIKGVGTWIYDNIFKPFIDGFKSAFGISSPSTVMDEQGGYIIAGLWEGIKKAWDGFWENVGALFDEFIGWVNGKWEGLKEGAATAWEGVKTTVSTKFNETKEKVSETVTKIKDSVDEKWKSVKEKTGEVWDNVKEKATAKFTEAKDTLVKTGKSIKDTITTKWNDVKSKTTDVWNNVKDTVSNKFDEAKTKLSTTADNIKTNIQTKWENIKTNTQTTWDNLKTKISSTADNIKTTVGTKWDNIKSTLQTKSESIKTATTNTFNTLKTNLKNTGDGIKTALDTVWNNVKNGASTGWTAVSNTVKNLFNGMKTSLANQSNSLYSVGQNLMYGLQNGVVNAYNSVINTVSRLANNITSYVNRCFRISSPSKVFAEIGEYLDLGLVEGLENEEDTILKKLRNISGLMTGVFEDSTVKIPNVAIGKVVPNTAQFTQALSAAKKSDDTNSNESDKDGGNHPPIVLQLDRRIVAQVVWDEEEKRYTQRNGYKPSFGF